MFKGVYTIEKRKATLVNGEWVAGELIETIEDENLVTPEILYRFHNNEGTNPADMRVYANEVDFTGAYMAWMAPGDGWIIGAITIGGTYVPAAGATDPYYYCVSTFNPPAVATRNIRSFAASAGWDSGNQYNQGLGSSTYSNAWSILTLDTPCTQTTTEILQVTYRIFFNRSAALANTRLRSYMMDSYARKMLNADGVYYPQPVYSFISAQRMDQVVGILNRGRTFKFRTMDTDSGSSLYVNNPGTVDVMNGVKQARIVGQFGASNVSTSPDWWIGSPIRSVGWGPSSFNDHQPTLWSPFDKGTTSSIQNVFPKAAYVSGNRPIFLNIPDISLSPAKVNLIDNGLWVSNIDDPITPYLYRINITNTGVTGVATYNLQRRRIYNFVINSWRAQAGIGIPTLPPWLGAGVESFTLDETYAKRHGFICNASSSYGSPGDFYGVQHSLRGGWCVKHYHYPQFIGFSQTGITIADVNAKHYTIDNYTTPTWNPTDILQLAHDGSTILVADGGTGLWKIERPFNDWDGSQTVITKIEPTGITNSNSCRGVTVKNVGAIVEFKILYGGTGYIVGDTINVDTENSMGSGFAGTVASIGPLGDITSITITNPGSGYHEDNVAGSVTSATGTGAKLVPIPGANGIWWAVFNDTTDNKCVMAWTADAGSTWTLYDETTVPQFALTNYTSGSPGPTNIIGIHIDPYSADDRLLIQAPSTVHSVTSSTSTNGQFFWWSRAGSTPTSNQVRANNSTANYALGEKRVGTLCVSTLNNTGQWITKGTSCSTSGLYSYGNAATTSTASNTIAIGPPTLLRGRGGNDVTTCHLSDSGGVHVYKNSSQLATANSEAIGLISEFWGSYSYVPNECTIGYENGVPNIQYIGKGVYLGWSPRNPGGDSTHDQRGYTAYTGNGDGTNTMQALLPYGNWENYGWDGTQWRLGNTNSKTTHGASEPLIDGLTISFNDNGGVDSYIVNEYYDGFVFDGMLNDNATTFSSYYNIYFGSAEKGDTFTPLTVPNSDVGSVVDEPFTVLQEWTNNWYFHPGVVAQRADTNNLAIGEQQLIGDFEFKFKVPAWSAGGHWIDIGVMTWANVVAGNRSQSAMTFNMRVIHTTASPTLQAFSIQCRNAFNGSVVQTINVTDGSPLDEYSFVRTGNTLEFRRNGTTFRVMTTSLPDDLAICFTGRNVMQASCVVDAKISYNINRRYVDIGDGATTGRFNPNYGRVNYGANGQNGEFAVYLDGVPATLLNTGYVAPAAGQVQWLRGRGSLWLNSADAGKVVTGKWITALKVNYE
jgi:hypothetical protein